MESEALELFYKEAMRVKEEKGRLANWFECKCPEYAENQFYASKRKNKIPSVAIVLQFEGHIEPAILYNLLKIKQVSNGNHERMIEEFLTDTVKKSCVIQHTSYARDTRELDCNNNYWTHYEEVKG